MDNQIKEAVEILNKGGIVVFPTDTAFGIGCRIDKPGSIDKLFKIRKRPYSQATPVLVSGFEMAKKYTLEIPKDVKKQLIDKFWPGALTIILSARVDKIPNLVRGGGKNIGLRMPNSSIILEIIKKVGVPILGPSANLHGEKTPFTKQELDIKLLKEVDFVVDGNCSLKDVSTVIDCTKKPWKILRHGAINIKNLGNKNVVLLVNTSSNKEIELEVQINGKKRSVKKALTQQKREVILNLIDQLLKENGISIYDLTAINVNTGPGSFTGLRVGIAIANTISSYLQIPINDKKIGDLENAVYN